MNGDGAIKIYVREAQLPVKPTQPSTRQPNTHGQSRHPKLRTRAITSGNTTPAEVIRMVQSAIPCFRSAFFSCSNAMEKPLLFTSCSNST
jgi:hypothetical protein